MRIRAALVAVGMAFAGLVVTSGASPAAAACAHDNACLYSGVNLSGYRYQSFYSQPSWYNRFYAGTSVRLWNGDGKATNVSSLENYDPNSTIAVYYNSGYAGACFTVAPYADIYDFRNVRLSNGTVANERMNSHHFNRSCGPLYYY